MADKTNTTAAKMTVEEAMAMIARLQADNAALKARKNTLTLKISDKGGLSVYGLGRFPVTLYKEQWLKLLGIVDQIKAYIAENESHLSVKD